MIILKRTSEYIGITIVLFPCPHAARSSIHVAVVPIAAIDEGKDSWEEESKGALSWGKPAISGNEDLSV